MNTKKIIEPNQRSKMLFDSLKKCKSLSEEGAVFIKLRELGFTFDQICEAVELSDQTVKTRVKIAELEPEIQSYFCKGGLPCNYMVVTAISNLGSERVRIVTELFEKKANIREILKSCNVKIPKARDPYARHDPKVMDMNLIDECAEKVCSRCALKNSKSLCNGCAATELVNWIKKSMDDH
jgi:hypothetical protein